MKNIQYSKNNIFVRNDLSYEALLRMYKSRRNSSCNLTRPIWLQQSIIVTSEVTYDR